MSSAPQSDNVSTALPSLLPSNFNRLSRDELIERLDVARGVRREFIRTLVLEKNRIDVLAKILGYDVAPHHLKIAQHQFRHVGEEYLILAPRGFGKTIIGTITKGIHLVLKRPQDIRILIASKTAENAKNMLSAIKKQFEDNALFRYYFGNFVGFDEWGSASIVVRQRAKPLKEPTIATIGVDGTIVSKHFDIILADDLVDEKNAKTEVQRKTVHTWYYKVLMPCLEPPRDEFEHRGEMSIIGTRYHFDDHYGHLIENECEGSTLHIPALVNEEGEADAVNGDSSWEEGFPTEELYKRKHKMGNIIFSAQMQNDVEAMKGEIFQFDDIRTCSEDDLPNDLVFYTGSDLAINQKESSDMFSYLTGGYHKKTGTYYIVDFFEGRLRFSQQTAAIIDNARRWNVAKSGVETNAYQEAQLQHIEDEDGEIPIVGIKTTSDKISRAWKLTPLFETGKVVFLDKFQDLIEKFVKFPNTAKKDWFDAFDVMVRTSKKKRRRRRDPDEEFGLL